MKYLKFLLFAGLTFFAFSTIIIAAPAPTFFAYNDLTKECGTYRDGDEYVAYEKLPSGWQVYDYDKSMAKSAQDYCNELGFKNIGSVVSYLNLQPTILMERPEVTKTSKSSNALLITFAIILGAIILVVAVFVSRKKTKP